MRIHETISLKGLFWLEISLACLLCGMQRLDQGNALGSFCLKYRLPSWLRPAYLQPDVK